MTSAVRLENGRKNERELKGLSEKKTAGEHDRVVKESRSREIADREEGVVHKVSYK
jgi:hypothetical protein